VHKRIDPGCFNRHAKSDRFDLTKRFAPITSELDFEDSVT